MASIADLFFAFFGDDKQLQVDAAKAGDKAGQILGGRMQLGVQAGIRLVGSSAGTLFGIAAKGGQQLLEATAAYRAETGATADEAAAAQQVIARLYQTNTQGFEELGATLAAVKVQMGLAGVAGEHAADKLLKFAKVTGQTGPAAVSALDDIMDSWNLKASDMAGLLDALIVGHQKWGGNIADNQSTLAKLAPAMRAANFEIGDGIALLNLFGSKGLDSERAAAAFSKALTKVKSPKELQKLITDISDTRDPFERAQKAADLFGTKAGAQLANALGGVHLADFATDTNTAAGALDRAAEAADSGPYEQLTLAIRKLAGPLAELGTNLGPLILGFASLGGPKMIVAVSAALGGLASKLILRPFAAVGTRIALLIAGRVAESSGIGDALGAALGKLPGAGAVKAGVAKLGTFLGTTLGKAAAVGFAAIVWLEVLNTFNRISAELAAQAAAISGDVGALLKTGTDAQLETAKAALKAGIDTLAEQARLGNVLALQPLQDTVNAYNEIQTELNRRFALNAQIAEDALKNARPGVQAAADALAEDLPTALEKKQARVAAAAREWALLPIAQQLIRLGHDARIAGAQAALDLASGLRDRRSAVTSAMDQLRSDLKNAISPRRLAAKDIGLLFGKDLTKGLHSADPVVKAQAKATRALLEDELIETIKAGGSAGKKIQEELQAKLHSKDPDVRAQAQRTKSIIDAALKAQTAAKTPGDVIGDQLNADLKNKGTPLGKTAYDLGRTIAKNLIAGVKGTGPVAPVGGAGGGTGTHHGGAQEFAVGTPFVPYDMLAYIHRGEMVIPAAAAATIRSGEAGLNGPLIGELHVDARGHDQPEQVGWAVRRAVADAMADALRQQTARLPVGTRA